MTYYLEYLKDNLERSVVSNKIEVELEWYRNTISLKDELTLVIRIHKDGYEYVSHNSSRYCIEEQLQSKAGCRELVRNIIKSFNAY